MPVIVTENKFCHSVYFPEEKILHSIYRGKPVKELVLEHYGATMNLIQTDQIIGSLIDLRKMFGSYFKYLELLTNDAYPKMQENGLSFLVFVIADDILIKNVTYKLTNAVEKTGIKVKVFYDIDLAKEWLKSNVQNI